MLIFAISAGCADPAYADPDHDRDALGGDDTAYVPVDDTATTAAALPVSGTITLRDFQSGAPLDGAVLTLESETWTTDASGDATVTIPGATTSMVQVDLEASVPARISLTADDTTGWAGEVFLPMETPLTALLADQGATWDPAKGILLVSVVEDGTGLGRTEVSISSAYDVAFAAQAEGYLPGATVGDGGNGTVVFANVDPGLVSATLDTPGAHTCVAFPSTTVEGLAFTVEAGAVTTARVSCTFSG